MERIIAPIYETVEVLAGTFSFIKPDKTEDTAEFYVRCEPACKPNHPAFDEINDRRVDALNRQYMDAYKVLESKACCNVKFTGSRPNPFF